VITGKRAPHRSSKDLERGLGGVLVDGGVDRLQVAGDLLALAPTCSSDTVSTVDPPVLNDDLSLATVAARPDENEDRHLKVLRRAGQPPSGCALTSLTLRIRVSTDVVCLAGCNRVSYIAVGNPGTSDRGLKARRPPTRTPFQGSGVFA
jgi:hypothetical protein